MLFERQLVHYYKI